MKKPNLKNKKWLLAVIVFVLVFGGATAAAYKLGQKSAADKAASNSNSQDAELEPSPPPEGEQPEDELAGQQKIFEDYKKQITDNSAEGIDKTTLYINAAYAGAYVKAPEAAGYAKEALNLMTTEMKTGPENEKIASDLQKISEGKYDEVSQ